MHTSKTKHIIMKHNVVLTLLASGLLVSCAYNASYRPVIAACTLVHAQADHRTPVFALFPWVHSGAIPVLALTARRAGVLSLLAPFLKPEENYPEHDNASQGDGTIKIRDVICVLCCLVHGL